MHLLYLRRCVAVVFEPRRRVTCPPGGIHNQIGGDLRLVTTFTDNHAFHDRCCVVKEIVGNLAARANVDPSRSETYRLTICSINGRVAEYVSIGV